MTSEHDAEEYGSDVCPGRRYYYGKMFIPRMKKAKPTPQVYVWNKDNVKVDGDTVWKLIEVTCNEDMKELERQGVHKDKQLMYILSQERKLKLTRTIPQGHYDSDRNFFTFALPVKKAKSEETRTTHTSEGGLTPKAIRYFTILNSGIYILNDTTETVAIDEAQNLVKKRLESTLEKHERNLSTDKEKNIREWLHWRLKTSIDDEIVAERYHPPDKTKTYITNHISTSPLTIKVINSTKLILGYAFVFSMIKDLRTTSNTQYRLVEHDGKPGKFLLEELEDRLVRGHHTRRLRDGKGEDGPDVRVINISGENVKDRNEIASIINSKYMRDEICTNNSIKFFVDEAIPRLIAIDKFGAVRGCWTVESHGPASRSKHHSKSGLRGREENSHRRQSNRETSGSDSEYHSAYERHVVQDSGSEGYHSTYERRVVKTFLPSKFNLINRCFTHNQGSESRALVHSGRPPNGLHPNYGYEVYNATGNAIWWDEMASALSKVLKFPAKKKKQVREIYSHHSDKISDSANILIRKPSGERSDIIMPWGSLGRPLDGCPMNKTHMRGQVKVYHHEGTPPYTLSVLNKLNKEWCHYATDLWMLVNTRLLRIKTELPQTNDGKIWRLQHSGDTITAKVELVCFDTEQRFSFNLEDSDNHGSHHGRSRSNGRHSSHRSSHDSTNAGELVHHNNNNPSQHQEPVPILNNPYSRVSQSADPPPAVIYPPPGVPPQALPTYYYRHPNRTGTNSDGGYRRSGNNQVRDETGASQPNYYPFGNSLNTSHRRRSQAEGSEVGGRGSQEDTRFYASSSDGEHKRKKPTTLRGRAEKIYGLFAKNKKKKTRGSEVGDGSGRVVIGDPDDMWRSNVYR
ncbi:hypothetical protein ACMFMG_009726 [Clarireedia jacksonii]